MAEPLTLIIVVIAVLGFGIVMKIFFKFMKWISLIMTVIFIAAAIFGYFVYQDTNELKERWPEEEKLFVLHDHQGIIAMASSTLQEDSIFTLTEAEVDIENMVVPQQYYKTILIDTKALKHIENIEVEDIVIPKAKALLFLRDEEVLKQQLPIVDSEEARQYIFTAILAKAIEDDPLILINEYRKGNIEMYPKTLVFEVLDYLPDDQIENIIKFEPSDES